MQLRPEAAALGQAEVVAKPSRTGVSVRFHCRLSIRTRLLGTCQVCRTVASVRVCSPRPYCAGRATAINCFAVAVDTGIGQRTDAGDVDVQIIRGRGAAGAERTAAADCAEQLGKSLPWIHPTTVALPA